MDISPFEPYLSWEIDFVRILLNFQLVVFSTKFVQFKALLKIKKIGIIAWKNHDIRRCLLKCLIYEFPVWTADYRITSQLKMQRTQLRLESLVVLFISFFNRRCQKEPYYEPHNKEWIKENIYVMLRKQAGKWNHQKSRQSLHSWEFCTRLWSCFSGSLKIVFFQMQQFSFPFTPKLHLVLTNMWKNY